MNIGIDLGTTFSLTAYLNNQGVPTLVPDAQQAQWYRTPSVVSVGARQSWVGQVLEELLLDEPGLPIARGFKLHMGTDHLPYTDEQGRQWPAEALSALVLKKLVRDVEAQCAETIDHCLITVPANFTDAQRKATVAAASLAGLSRVSLIEEPIAAAAHYGFSRKDAEQTLLVYDFGGGTFDASVLHISEGRLYVLATEGDNRLGGRNIDQALTDLLRQEVRLRHSLDLQGDDASLETLRRFAEAAKIGLSQPGQGLMRKTLVLAGKAVELSLSPEQVRSVVEPIVQQTIKACQRALDGAGLGWGQMDQVLLVGGSSLLPEVGKALSVASGRPPSSLMAKHPHQAVAYGAAVLAEAAAADHGTAEPVHQGVAPYHLGLRVRDATNGQDRMEVMLKRNTPLPAKASTTVYTHRPDQSRVILDIVQGKGGAEPLTSLGHFAFGPLRAPQKNYPVEVTLAYDVQGMVRVAAKDLITGQSLERELSASADADASRVLLAKQLLDAVQR